MNRKSNTTYQKYTGEASLHLLKGDPVLYADDLLLHRYCLLQPLKYHIRKICNYRKGVIGRVCNKRVQHFVGSRPKLVVRIASI